MQCNLALIIVLILVLVYLLDVNPSRAVLIGLAAVLIDGLLLGGSLLCKEYSKCW